MDFSFWLTFQVDGFPRLIHLVTEVLCKAIEGTAVGLLKS